METGGLSNTSFSIVDRHVIWPLPIIFIIHVTLDVIFSSESVELKKKKNLKV